MSLYCFERGREEQPDGQVLVHRRLDTIAGRRPVVDGVLFRPDELVSREHAVGFQAVEPGDSLPPARLDVEQAAQVLDQTGAVGPVVAECN